MHVCNVYRLGFWVSPCVILKQCSLHGNISCIVVCDAGLIKRYGCVLAPPAFHFIIPALYDQMNSGWPTSNLYVWTQKESQAVDIRRIDAGFWECAEGQFWWEACLERTQIGQVFGQEKSCLCPQVVYFLLVIKRKQLPDCTCNLYYRPWNDFPCENRERRNRIFY